MFGLVVAPSGADRHRKARSTADRRALNALTGRTTNVPGSRHQPRRECITIPDTVTLSANGLNCPLDIRHSDLAMRVSHGNAAAGPMATRESITTVGQGARGAP